MTGVVGELSILNVGYGDTKLTFDNKNPAETIRAARIVKDMLHRGYALLVEVDQPDGTKAFQRALDFDPARNEYIVADFDASYATAQPPMAMPLPAEGWKPQTGLDDGPTLSGDEDVQSRQDEASAPAPVDSATAAPRTSRRRGRPSKRVPASGTRAVAVARSAGG
jgi:hypothetical protein